MNTQQAWNSKLTTAPQRAPGDQMGNLRWITPTNISRPTLLCLCISLTHSHENLTLIIYFQILAKPNVISSNASLSLSLSLRFLHERIWHIQLTHNRRWLCFIFLQCNQFYLKASVEYIHLLVYRFPPVLLFNSTRIWHFSWLPWQRWNGHRYLVNVGLPTRRQYRQIWMHCQSFNWSWKTMPGGANNFCPSFNAFTSKRMHQINNTT